MSTCQVMRRCRPVPLINEEDRLSSDTDTTGSYEVVVKNTFLEVGGAPELDATDLLAAGLSTAPASLHRAGAMKVSLAVAAQTPRMREAGLDLNEADSASTQTPGSTPPTPSQVCLWPPTPASPTVPVRLSLVDLTAFEPCGGMAPAGGSTSPGLSPPVQGPPGFAEPSAVPPPPMGSPKLPPDVLLPDATAAAHAGPGGADGSPFVACVVNARAPLFAPPSGPAPEPEAEQQPAEFDVPPLKAPGTC